ncbi:hypothetical protein ACT7DO_06635 [Bacillus pacificus]
MANKELKRGLEARHIQMIALGGTIGVGLFMGSASTIKWTGPSVMLAYAIAGIFYLLHHACHGRNVVYGAKYRVICNVRS